MREAKARLATKLFPSLYTTVAAFQACLLAPAGHLEAHSAGLWGRSSFLGKAPPALLAPRASLLFVELCDKMAMSVSVSGSLFLAMLKAADPVWLLLASLGDPRN